MKNLLLGAKIVALASLMMAFVACDKDDDNDDDPIIYGLTVSLNGTTTYYDEDADFRFDFATETLTMTGVKFTDSAMPALNITITNVTDSDQDGDYEIDGVVDSSNISVDDYPTVPVTISDLEVEKVGDLIEVEFDCLFGGSTYEVDYYGKNRQ